jgi:rubrerythrin
MTDEELRLFDIEVNKEVKDNESRIRDALVGPIPKSAGPIPKSARCHSCGGYWWSGLPKSCPICVGTGREPIPLTEFE